MKSDEFQNKPTRKINVALLFSGFVVAASFIVLLIPLALFNVAQIGALLGKKAAFLLVSCVALALLFLGFLFSSSLVFLSGVLACIMIPFFMGVIFFRERNAKVLYPTMLLMTPVILIIGFVCFTPTLNQTEYAAKVSEFQTSFEAKKKSALTARDTNPEVVALLNTKDDETRAYISSLAQNKKLIQYFSYTAWQRILWLVFEQGSVVLFMIFLNVFANLVFADMAFEQTDKIKAIMKYVTNNRASFSPEFVAALRNMPLFSQVEKLNPSITITRHFNFFTENNNSDSSKPRFSLFKSKKPINTIRLREYSFVYDGELNSWGLKKFALPLPLALCSIAYLGALGFWAGSAEAIITKVGSLSYPLAQILPVACLISFMLLSILTLQGVFAVYERVSTFFTFFVLISLFMLGTSFSFGPYLLLAIFGSVALLDYVYGWRSHKAQT